MNRLQAWSSITSLCMKTGNSRPFPISPARMSRCTAGLVIDTSGSMRPNQASVITAALAFIGASNRSDEIFVVHFSDRVRSRPFPPTLRSPATSTYCAPPCGEAIRKAARHSTTRSWLSLKHLEQGKRDRRTAGAGERRRRQQ